MLFDNDLHNDAMHDVPPDNLNVEKVHTEVKHWLQRNSAHEAAATNLLQRYSADVSLGHTPGMLPEPLYKPEPWNEKRIDFKHHEWRDDIEDKYEQDRVYGRVSREIDIWWKRVRDANYDGWNIAMESVVGAQSRANEVKSSSMLSYGISDQDEEYENDHYDCEPEEALHGHDEFENGSLDPEIGDEEDDDDEEEDEDDDSYVEGPLRGLLTEIPNILDTKQIEALHMTVKACIVDSMGSGLSPVGENLQKTRCKMFLALDCGKNLLREMLVFIAVWEQAESSFIFQITAQIIESFHHNALLPYAWTSLKIMKDIVSPAQTVLLRLISYMFRARRESPIYDDTRDFNRDAKLIHFLYNYYRCRVVPDCIALIDAQAQIRHNKVHPADFPVDLWDMERAKDGLSQYLELISVVVEIPEMRPLLIQWEAIYELVALLKALEEGVARKTFDEGASSSATTANNRSQEGKADSSDARAAAIVPPLQDNPHRFPWSGIKNQILIILTSLVAPANKTRTGTPNAEVQQQLLAHDGVMAVLQCASYDGHNDYIKERATLAIKYMMDGCKPAQDIVKSLNPVRPPNAQNAPQGEAVAPTRRQRVASEPSTGTSQKARAEYMKYAHRTLVDASGELGHAVAQDIAAKLKLLQERPDSENVLAEVSRACGSFLAPINISLG